ncbi:hypothetical protein BCM02_10568 [Paenibacillus methanolicus]|uniref:Uncharacterized protein n=1 Tax=Paenibacillus methanolicus TaxID=582686 RepID=A0A5S5C5B3_9BACL|nr:hypothetical protein BCM02_10568 [Paenibacillus methanolicus]
MSEIAEIVAGKVDDITSHTIDYGFITVNSDKAREGYPVLLKLIEERKLEYFYAENRSYTKNEMEAAAFFHMNVPYLWEQPERDAMYYGTQFNNHNMDCECQWQQVSELKLDVKKMKKWHLVTMAPQFVVTEQAKNAIVDNGLTGCEFSPTHDYKGRELGAVYQMHITSILPPLNPRTRIETDYRHARCPHCVSGVFPRSELIYEQGDFSAAQDFNLTYERLNGLVVREMVISWNARNIFKANKIKVHGYEPVALL